MSDKRRIVVPADPRLRGPGGVEVPPEMLATAQVVTRILNQVLPEFERHLAELFAAYVDKRLEAVEGDFVAALKSGTGPVGGWARELEARLRDDLGILVELEADGALPEVRREEDAAKGWADQDRATFEYVEEEHHGGDVSVTPAAG